MNTKLALITLIISLPPSYPAYSINGHLKERISNIEKNSKKNAGRLNTNEKNIGNNSTNIGTNSKNIGDNTKKIENNAKKIGTNGENIGANAKKIESNAKNIDTNSDNIGTNAKKIESNAKNIGTNGDNIGANAKKIESNAKNIGTNAKKIDSNAKNIDTNAKQIETNNTKIDANNERIIIVEKSNSKNTRSLKLMADELHGFETETKERFSKMGKTISQNHKKAMAGISAAMAMNAIPFIEGKTVSMGLGSGSYGGQGSMAFGSQFRISENIKSSTFMSYDSNKNVGVAAGISFGW